MHLYHTILLFTIAHISIEFTTFLHVLVKRYMHIYHVESHIHGRTPTDVYYARPYFPFLFQLGVCTHIQILLT